MYFMNVLRLPENLNDSYAYFLQNRAIFGTMIAPSTFLNLSIFILPDAKMISTRDKVALTIHQYQTGTPIKRKAIKLSLISPIAYTVFRSLEIIIKQININYFTETKNGIHKTETIYKKEKLVKII